MKIEKRPTNPRLARTVQERTIIQYIVDAPNAMYDIGVGIYNEYNTLKKAYPEMHVYGCEPHPQEYQDLIPLFPGELLNVGIGKIREETLLYTTDTGIGGSTLLRKMRENAPSVSVTIWTLDEFDLWAKKPDKILLWLDIEGGELAALIGGENLLSSGRVHYLNIETRDVSPMEGYPCTQDITNHLARFGYLPVLRYNVQGSYPEAAGDVIYVKKAP